MDSGNGASGFASATLQEKSLNPGILGHTRMAYEIKLEVFEGPLDLLLFLIKKNEIDIYNIPIAAITEEYLKHLEAMKSLNLDLAGEYLVMASTLVHIKSRMLLPVSEDESEIDEEGPRAELVRQLLEYKAFKEAALDLGKRNLLGRDVFKRAAFRNETWSGTTSSLSS